MINIIQGATNSFVLRLSDNITIENPIFLFELKSIQSNQTFYFTPEDTSTTDRFNKFTIYEIGLGTQSIAVTASVPYIQLEYGGSYLYKVYQADSYDLQPTDKILDSGVAIFKNGEYEDFFFEVNDDIDSSVFDEYELLNEFNFEDELIYKIFDPEFAIGETYYILTEEGDILMTESNDNLIWN